GGDRQARCSGGAARLAGLGHRGGGHHSCGSGRGLRGRLRRRAALQPRGDAARAACSGRGAVAKSRAACGADQGLWLPAAHRERNRGKGTVKEPKKKTAPEKQLLHLVFGGELEDMEG